MPKDAIEKILEVEEQAGVLCRVASERAAEMCAELERTAGEHLEKAVAATTAEYEQRLAQIEKGTARLLEKKRAEAEAEAAAFAARALQNAERAADIIVWGMVEKCR